MATFKTLEMVNLLKGLSIEEKNKKAQTSDEIKEEIKNVLNDTTSNYIQIY